MKDFTTVCTAVTQKMVLYVRYAQYFMGITLNQHIVQKVLVLIKVYYLRIIQGKNCDDTNGLMITKMPFVQKLT